MANLEPMPISSLPEGDIQDGDKMVIYRETTGKAYQTDAGIIENLNADLTDIKPTFSTLDEMIEYVNKLTTLQTVSFGCRADVNQTLTGNNSYGKGLVQKMNADNYFDYLIYSTSYIYSGRYNNGTISLRRFEGTSISLSSVGDPVVMGDEDNAED